MDASADVKGAKHGDSSGALEKGQTGSGGLLAERFQHILQNPMERR